MWLLLGDVLANVKSSDRCIRLRFVAGTGDQADPELEEAGAVGESEEQPDRTHARSGRTASEREADQRTADALALRRHGRFWREFKRSLATNSHPYAAPAKIPARAGPFGADEWPREDVCD